MVLFWQLLRAGLRKSEARHTRRTISGMFGELLLRFFFRKTWVHVCIFGLPLQSVVLTYQLWPLPSSLESQSCCRGCIFDLYLCKSWPISLKYGAAFLGISLENAYNIRALWHLLFLSHSFSDLLPIYAFLPCHVF